jgi:acyl carrier protein
MNDLKKTLIHSIQHFLLERGVLVEDDDIADYDFIAAGTLDSFEILSLIMSLETEYAISVPPELLVSPENAKVGNLATALMNLNDRN